MLKLISTEFFKLRRKKQVWGMLLGAAAMPVFAMMYFGYQGEKGVIAAEFYRWSAFSWTLCIILPFILGVFCTILMHDENRYDVQKQLWLVPVSRMGYFFSKFFVVLVYSICFMMITAAASALFGMAPGYVEFSWENLWLLVKNCVLAAVLSAFAVIPVLGVAAWQKGYVLPVCFTLIYAFFGLFVMTVNMYLSPVSCVSAIIAGSGEFSGAAFAGNVSVPLSLFCIFVWDVLGTALGGLSVTAHAMGKLWR